MNSIFVFLGGPVDRNTVGDGWKEEVINRLNEKISSAQIKSKYVGVDPAKIAMAIFGREAITFTDDIAKRIIALNRALIDFCDVAIFNYPDGVQTIGTTVDMEYATQKINNGMQVYAIHSDPQPAYLIGIIGRHLIHNSIDDFISRR